jgi:opacity protein-like surface antigen
MNYFKSAFVYGLTLALVSLFISETSHAQMRSKRGGKGVFAGGSISIGAGIAFANADQTGLNALIDSAKVSANSSVSKFSSATEFLGYATFRFANGFTAVQLRPSLFQQSTAGSGTDGTHKYELSGYTIFPMARIIPLSNDFIDFYMQAGLGYGKLDGTVRNGSRSANFSGSAFGAQVGLGAEFCFVPSHCVNVEGNYRYLPIERNLVSSGTGPANLPYGTTQASPDSELEDANGRDIATTLSGISGLVSYTFNF